MDITFRPVGLQQSKNREILRQGVLKKDGSAVECLYVGPSGEYELFDEEQLACLASIDNDLMKLAGRAHISNMEVYANGAINLFIKDTQTSMVAAFILIRPTKDEQEHYDQIARDHGQD